MHPTTCKTDRSFTISSRLAGFCCPILSALLFPAFLAAQPPESRIHLLDAGSVSLDFDLYLPSDLDYGYLLSSGQVLAGLSRRENPAFLYLSKDAQFRLVAGLPYSVALSSLVDLETTARQTISTATAPYTTPSSVVRYPGISASAHLAMPLEGAVLTFPAGPLRLLLGYENLWRSRVAASLAGTRVKVSTTIETGQAPSEVILNALTEADLSAYLRLSRLRLGASFRVASRTVAGVELLRLLSDVDARGTAQVDASMLYAGSEYAFNDPTSPWPTDLNQDLTASYSGATWGLRLGLWHLLRSSTVLDLAVDFGFRVKCQGWAKIRQNRIPAFNLDALLLEEGGEILEASKLKLTQLTLTEPIPTPSYSEVRLTGPASVRLGFLQTGRTMSVGLGARVYVGSWGLSYGPTDLEVSPLWSATATVSFWRVFIQAEVQRLSLSSRNAGRYLGELSGEFLVPTLQVGYARSFGPVTSSYLLRLLPIPSLHVLVGVVL